MVKNLPCDAGGMGSIPGQGPKIPHVTEQLKPMHHNYERSCMTQQGFRVPLLRPSAGKYINIKKKKKSREAMRDVEKEISTNICFRTKSFLSLILGYLCIYKIYPKTPKYTPSSPPIPPCI